MVYLSQNVCISMYLLKKIQEMVHNTYNVIFVFN